MITAYSDLSGQSHDYLFHPSFFDQYLKMQTLTGNKVRVFTVSDQNNSWTNPRIAYADFSADSLIQDQVPIIISTPGEFINSLVHTPFMLRCADGSTVIASNFFDCDSGGADAIYKLKEDGEVAWVYSFWNSGDLTEILHLAFIDSNTISVGKQGGAVFFDLDGNVLQADAPENILRYSAQTEFGYMGSIGDSLILLDQNFAPLYTYLLEGDLVSIDDVLLNEFRIKTTEGYYELKEDLMLYSLPFTADDFDQIWSSTNYYWGYQGNQNVVIQWDTFFNTVDTFHMAPGVFPVAGIPLDNEVLVLNAYQNLLSQGVLAFQDNEESIDFQLLQDIGITEIIMEDTVLVEFYNWPAPNPGWVYHIPELTVTIENFGPDTISKFFLQAHASLECFWWCMTSSPFWLIDSLHIPPGGQGIVKLSEFVTHCGNELDPQICLSTIAPDRKADGNYLNDKHCQSFDFILGTNEQIHDVEMSIYPNPVTDYLYLNSGSSFQDFVNGSIYNSEGQLIQDFEINGDLTTIDVNDYPSGFYVVKTKSLFGRTSISRFVVVR